MILHVLLGCHKDFVGVNGILEGFYRISWDLWLAVIWCKFPVFVFSHRNARNNGLDMFRCFRIGSHELRAHMIMGSGA